LSNIFKRDLKMKRLFIVILTLWSLSIPLCSNAGSVFEVKSKGDADVCIYLVNSKSDADLCVYVADSKSDAKGKDEIWYYVKDKGSADVTICFVDSKSDAGVKVCIVKSKSDAEWKKANKWQGRLK